MWSLEFKAYGLGCVHTETKTTLKVKVGFNFIVLLAPSNGSFLLDGGASTEHSLGQVSRLGYLKGQTLKETLQFARPRLYLLPEPSTLTCSTLTNQGSHPKLGPNPIY